MALQTFRTDDLTQEPDAQTVLIVVNGKGVEVDLAAKSMARLVKALEPFWTAGRESNYDVTPRASGRSSSSYPELSKVERLQIREWAAERGLLPPGQRGRIPREVVDQYRSR